MKKTVREAKVLTIILIAKRRKFRNEAIFNCMQRTDNRAKRERERVKKCHPSMWLKLLKLWHEKKGTSKKKTMMIMMIVLPMTMTTSKTKITYSIYRKCRCCQHKRLYYDMQPIILYSQNQRGVCSLLFCSLSSFSPKFTPFYHFS